MVDTVESDLRFEHLAGRFFDGLLNAVEDEEFVALLQSRPELARRFVLQARTERIIFGLTASERLGNHAFTQAITRSVALLDNEVENERFAREVVKLVRDGAASRTGRQSGMLRARRRTEQSKLPLTIGIASAAMLLLALLLAFSRPTSVAPSGTVAETNPLRTEAVDLAKKPEPSIEIKVAPQSLQLPENEVVREDNEPATPTAAIPSEHEAIVAIKPQPTPRPVPSKIEIAAPNAPRTEPTLAAIGSISQIKNAKASITHAAKKGETIARAGEACAEGDVLHVTSLDVSTSELPAGPRGVDVRLADGSLLWLKEGSTLVFHAEGAAARPILESGEVVARVAPQIPESNLIIRTKQGPEASVLGTVFHVIADPNSKRVELRVDEGKVQFSNKGEKRIIGPDEACVAEDGKAPGAAYMFRPKLASLSGVILDKDSGKPIEGADVAVIPYAQRQKAKRPAFGAKTDAQGKFAIHGLYEGPVFVFAKTDDGGAVGLNGRASIVRTRLSSGEKASLTINIDKGSVAAGRVVENGKLVNNYVVRLLPVNNDGYAMDVRLNLVKTPTVDYGAVALEGAGKYIAVVEKPGSIARIKGAKPYELRPDRVTNWPIDVQLLPSAVLKGRVVNAGGVALTDLPDMPASDPRQPRTILTLTSATGGAQLIEAEPDGSFNFDTNVDSGVYELRIERFGYAPFTKRMNLLAGQTTEFSATLDLKPVSR